MKIVVIGSGNLAQALCKVISESEMELVQVFARNSAKAEEIASRYCCQYTSQCEELAQADLYVLAIAADGIASLSAKLDFGDAVVVHTAGTVSVEKLHSHIADRGVIYPLQIFTKWRDIDFRPVPILIDGTTPRAVECIRQFANEISDCVHEYTLEQRLRVSLAIVFANNFSNYMYVVSEQILAKVGLPFDLMKPLITESTLKAMEQGALPKIETDIAVNFLTRIVHCDMLHYNLNFQKIYINLSNNILEMQKKP